MLLLIQCPECAKSSETEDQNIARGKLKVTCHACEKQFILDKGCELNCKFQASDVIYEDDGWRVDNATCQGMTYDVAGLGGLIRSGFIEPVTRLLPPGEIGYHEARHINQLKKFFEQKEQDLTKAKKVKNQKEIPKSDES